MLYDMNVGGTLRAARKAAGLTQTELARLAGVPQSTVGRIEAGITMPRIDMCMRLLALCGWTLDAQPVPHATTWHDRSHLDDAVPPFMWDSDMTWDRFRTALRDEDPDVRGWAYARLLSEGHWDDIWSEVTPADVIANLPLTRFRSKPAWERLVEYF